LVLVLVALALACMSLPAGALADPGQTDLVLTGDQSGEMTSSDANACYFDSSNVFNAQLTDPTSSQIISIQVAGSVGDHPAKADDGHAQLTMLGLDTTQDNPFVAWTATSGTVTLDNASTQIALDDGSAGTQGALGHIEADLTSTQGTLHISGPFACHLAG
jgi:hypothetical protein